VYIIRILFLEIFSAQVKLHGNQFIFTQSLIKPVQFIKHQNILVVLHLDCHWKDISSISHCWVSIELYNFESQILQSNEDISICSSYALQSWYTLHVELLQSSAKGTN